MIRYNGSMTSHYDVLGVGADADLDEVRRAYYRKAQRLHPDRYAGSSDPERRQAEAEMKAVNVAWSTLKNPEARRRYDAELGVIGAGAEDERRGHDERRSGTRLAVACLLLLSIVASVIAAVSRSDDDSPRWSAGAVAELRFAALNAGLSTPQAECFVEAITRRYGPSEPVDPTITRQILNACR
jgi:curved DNA-binding protein CbpA